MRVRTTASSFFFATSVVLAFFVACSSEGLRPAAQGDPDGGGIPGVEASTRDDGAGGDGGEAGLCTSLMKDGDETDVDCGGPNSCPRCELGKSCVSKTDCALGADCMNKVCALCQDKVTNGDESDTDCGGKACGACTVGKRCKTGTDCRSGTCTNNACACPKDMTIISLASGGAYCIDQSEVSKGQYFHFITANVPVSSQAGACLTANTTFVPRGAWPPATAPQPPGIEFSMGLPVHYVDWCDAVAYCKWAKKELCGLVNGGTLPLASSGDAEKSAWYNACSAQGTKTYPYGAVAFDNTRCNTDGLGTSGPVMANNRGDGFGYAANQDDGVYRVAISNAVGDITGPDHTACQGGSVGVYQMSGNVAEWEDSCAGTAAGDTCRVRGGSYADTSTDQVCTATRDVVRMPPAVAPGDPDPLKDVGIRCCQY